MISRNEVKDKVQRILSKNFDARLNSDGFSITFGSSVVLVNIEDEPWQVGNKEIWKVRIIALVLRDVELSDELARKIATTDLIFGALHFISEEDRTGIVAISHTLIGNTLDEDELGAAVACVGNAADNLDDDWQIRFGGLRLRED